MSFCNQCESLFIREEDGKKCCSKFNAILQKCAGGCTKNRKNNAESVALAMAEKEETKKKILSGFLDKIVNGDSLELMKKLPSDSVDVIITSPPYNLRNSSGNTWKCTDAEKAKKWWTDKHRYNPALLMSGYDVHDDNMPYDEYIKWQRDCLAEMVRILRPTGFIFYNHKQRVQLGILQHRMEIMDGFPLRQIITWKRNGGVNYNKSYFIQDIEQIFVLAKSRKAYLRPKANAFGCVWQISQNTSSGRKGHPAPFPIELPSKCLDSQILTKDSVVLDPFIGGGTIAIAALKHNIHYIGFDLSPGYCKMAEDRISEFKTKQNEIPDQPDLPFMEE